MLYYVPVIPCPVFVRVMDVQDTDNSFKMTFATLEGHPEAGYVTFSGSFDEKTGVISFTVLTETREVIGISRIGPSRSVQQEQWEIVIGNVRKNLGKDKKEVTETEHIEEYKFDATKPMGKGQKKPGDKTKIINE
jgi:hypothetical protein